MAIVKLPLITVVVILSLAFHGRTSALEDSKESTLSHPSHSAGKNTSNNCTIDFILKTCKPYKTFQSCKHGKCLCPTDLKPPLLKHNLSISTYWDSNHRQCVSKLNSVCFYLPPSFLVSQPYRCVIPNAECVQAPGQFKGVGMCKCKDSHDETSMGDCKTSGQSSDNNVYVVGKKYSGSDQGNKDDSSSGKDFYSFQPQSQCTWKFQCPHLQECVDGQCSCPSEKIHKNGYWQNMIWDDKEKICLSLSGSYCNNARFQKSDEDMLIKTILSSMMEVRCAPGLTCEDSEGFEIGTCNSCIQIKSNVLAMVLYLVSVLGIMYS